MDQIPLFEIYWDEEDIKTVTDLMKSGKYWADGPLLPKLEEKIANYMGSKYCVLFNSGTSAQTSILQALGINNGDEVIVPSFTFISTANSVVHNGAKPVFIDIEDNNMGIDPNKIEGLITSKTKAISPIHYAGGAALINEIREISEKYDLYLIEDNAESMGHIVNGKSLGTFGDAAILSFCQNKIMTTGEGGAVITDNEEIFKKLKLLCSHGRSTKDYFSSGDNADYILPGYNYRMPSLNAALGLSQLNKIDFMIEKRRNVAKKYIEGMQNIDELSIVQRHQKNHVFQLFPILVKNGKRDELKSYLQKEKISSKIYFDPVHESTFYRNKFPIQKELNVTKQVTNSILNLPIFPNMKDEQISYIIQKIKDFFRLKK